MSLTFTRRNPSFLPSDRNTFFFYLKESGPTFVIKFYDHDAVGHEKIGRVHLSFASIGDRCPSDIISLPIVIKKPKTSPIRGYVDLRYGLVSLVPPLPSAELLARHSSQPLSPFSQFLQRMVRFLQVDLSHASLRRHHCTQLALTPPIPPFLPPSEIRPPLPRSSARHCMDSIRRWLSGGHDAQLGAALGSRTLMCYYLMLRCRT
jgi:hypothetical protein